MICYVTTGAALVGEQSFYAEVLLDCCCCGYLFLVLKATFVLVARSLREHLGYNGIKELDDGGVLISLADLNKAAEDVDYSMKTKVHLKEMFARKRMTESAKEASPTVKAKDKERDSLLGIHHFS
ncbi:hypothetical protein FXO38_20906 [Capsicum annuum]|nr:hypothetical protein FXO38_20906 [Capsicum annuum]KAF3645788.1 hypothetical protein FXO37_20794 [Capsicum annuum]